MPALAVQKRGDAIPEAFTRSVYLAGADGEPWERDLNAALEGAELQDSIVFVGDEIHEPDANGWRAQATRMSDAVVCYIRPDAV